MSPITLILRKMTTWKNDMAINPRKTVCMTIGPQRKLSKLIELLLSVQGITLQSVEKEL